MKGNKGITLIALVITIIVLLILAGVSIAMLSGDNSILKRGQESSVQTAVVNARDDIALKVSECITEYNAVKYAGATSTLYGNDNTKTLDAFILEQIKTLTFKDATVTVASKDLKAASGAPAETDITAEGVTIEVTSTKSPSVKSSATWKKGGNISSWTNTGFTS